MLADQVKNLSHKKLFDLKSTMTEAAVAFEIGGNPKEIFRRAKHRNIGLLRRIYAKLEKADREGLRSMSDALIQFFQ